MKIDWFTHTTGDPFADTGGLVIEYLQEKEPNKSIMDLIKDLIDIYVSRWDNNLHSFFLNSTITHNSNKGQRGVDNTIKYYQGLLDGKDGIEGYCRITGQKTKVFPAGRDNHMMSGSGTFINFHHAFENGIMLSKEALIRMFFVPLGVELLGDKVAIVTSNKEEISRYFIRKNVDNNLRDLGSNISKSIQRSDFLNPTNALFDYANQCIENIKTVTYQEEIGLSDIKDVSLNLFHFTNFGAKPTIDLYTLPATVFSFYAYCMVKYRQEWKYFIYQHYSSSKFKNAEFNDLSESWQNARETADYQIFKIWKNRVFEYLLAEKSLLSLFLLHSKKHLLNFTIVELYQINIRNMDKRALNKIKDLAAFIVDNRSDNDIKKTMTRLNGAKNANELRYLLIKMEDKNYKEGYEKPLFTLDEYVEYLFPDGTYWKEIRDLLLIAIYQKLHETNKQVEIELQESEVENE